MKSAAARLILISLGVILTVFVVLFGLRLVGLSQQHAQIRHPLMKKSFLIVAEGGLTDEAPAYTRPAFDAAVDLNPELLLEADIQITKDDQWVVFPPVPLEKLTDGQGLIRQHTLEELKQLDAGHLYSNKQGEHTFRGKGVRILTLDEFLRRYPDQGLVLDVQVKDVFSIDRLIEQLEGHQTDERLIIQSPYAATLSQIKDEYPLWLYGIAPATLTRFRVMESLFLEPFADLWADLVITPLLISNQPVLTPRLLAEIERRQKRLIVEYNDDFESLPPLILQTLDGVQTSSAKNALSFFGDRLRKERLEP